MRCSRDEVLITNGAKHATELAVMVFTEPGDRVIVTAPTYMTTLQCFRNHGVSLLAIPQDDEGLDAGILRARLETMAVNGEPLLHAYLVNNVHLVRFQIGKIALRRTEEAPKDLAMRVSRCLSDWTGRAWFVDRRHQPRRLMPGRTQAVSAAGGDSAVIDRTKGIEQETTEETEKKRELTMSDNSNRESLQGTDSVQFGE